MPVTYPLSSEARNTTALATSSGVPIRPNGTWVENAIAPSRVRPSLLRPGVSLIDQRLRLARCAIVDGDLVPSLYKPSGHGGSHLPEADESHFHDCRSCLNAPSIRIWQQMARLRRDVRCRSCLPAVALAKAGIRLREFHAHGRSFSVARENCYHASGRFVVAASELVCTTSFEIEKDCEPTYTKAFGDCSVTD
jgi:hypothetical protein